MILNWNGRFLLQESLPALEDALGQTSIPHEVIIVDNGSSDDSIAFVRENFPRFQILALPRNLGFGEGNNAGVKASRHGLVLLLNNDMIVRPQFLEPLIEAMSPEIFAATSQVFLPDEVRREETGKTTARIRHGLLELSHDAITRADEERDAVYVLWAGGGSSLYRKDLFLSLGGFDPLYSPSYAEDADISFRAWQAGYPSVIALRSHVLHKHKSSTRRRFGEAGAQRLMYKNIRLCFLRNFSLPTLWRYLLWLPANTWANGELALLARTVAQWPAILARRIRRNRPALKEREILRRLGTRAHSFGVRGQQMTEFPNLKSTIRNRQLPLRVLYVCAYAPHLWRHGGAGRVYQLIRRVAQTHQASIVTFYENDFERKECDKLRGFCESVVTIYRHGRPATNIFPYEPFEEFDLPEMRLALRQIGRENYFDIVHFEFTQMARYADLFPDSVKFLTEVEVNYAAAASKIAYLPSAIQQFKWYYNSMQVLDRELELCRKVDHVVCVNETDAALLRGYLSEGSVHVVHTGVDVEYFTPDGDSLEEPLTLGFVAAFRHEPNVDAALFFTHQVFPLIKQKLPSSRLYLVGSTPTDEVQSLHNGDDIIVTGFVEDLLQYYHRMSIIVVPLRTGVGIRGKILEAWAAGKPVVGTTLAAAGIEARQGENMYIADQPEELALWAARLLEAADARRHMSRHARRTAELYYDWNMLAERLCRLYERSVMDRQPLSFNVNFRASTLESRH